MNIKALNSIHNFCVWSGVAFALLTLVGMGVFAGFIPPPSPALNAAEVSAIYNSNPNSIRVGAVLMMLGASFFIPFTAEITRHIIRVEGGVGVITVMQIMGGTFNMLLFFFPSIWWLNASFRLDRSPELVEVLHDAGWIQFVGALFPFLFQLLSVSMAAFIDDSKTPSFPRWFGWLNLWTILLYLPGQMIFFFKTGPFAWNGLLAFWLPGATFFTWTLVMFFVLKKAVADKA